MPAPPEQKKTNRVHVITGELRMDINTLDLPQNYIDFYLNKGYTTLYPPQAECMEKGLLKGKNVFCAIPTASGKTFLAELAMLKAISKGKKAMYIVPLRALAKEKYTSFKDFVPLGINPGIASGDYNTDNRWLEKCNIIVCTAEKADSLLRSEASWIDDVTCVVIDEVHLLACKTRGPTLEMVTTKLREKNSQIQFVSLSATVGNAEEVARWLQSELITTDWRPADLREGIFFQNKIQFSKYSIDINPITNDPSINIAIDTVNIGGQCLVFETSRNSCSDFAKKLSKHISPLITEKNREELNKLSIELDREEQSNPILSECIRNGVAFHHAGLNEKQRDIVESGFKNGLIKIITCTPTLAAGLNLPARRVIIRNYKRFNPGQGRCPIPVLDYKQMAGRAGRPHLDPYGESVLIAESEKDIEKLKATFINAQAELVISNLAQENHFETHLLATINNKFANTLEDINHFLRKTLFGFQNPDADFENLTTKCLKVLHRRKMIEICDRIESTPFGKMVSVVYIYPETASIITSKIEKSLFITPFNLMSIICSTPNMKNTSFTADERKNIENIIIERSNEIPWINATKINQITPQEIGSIKTALMLMEWINGTPIETIMRNYKIGEGDLKNTISTAKWLVYATRKIMEMQDNIWTSTVSDIEKMLEKGANNEMLALMTTTSIDRVSAKKLYDNKIDSLDILKTMPLKDVIEILGLNKSIEIFNSLGIDYDLFKVIDEIEAQKKQQTETKKDMLITEIEQEKVVETPNTELLAIEENKPKITVRSIIAKILRNLFLR